MPTKPTPVSRLKTKYTRNLEEEVVSLKGDKMDLVTALENEEDKVRGLRRERDNLRVKVTKAEERVGVTVQAMTFIISYCAKEINLEPSLTLHVPAPLPERIAGTQEGSVMAWSIAKNWLEGHWSHVGSENDMPDVPRWRG